MTSPAPAQYNVQPAPLGWWRIVDPAGTEVFVVRDAAVAITAADQLTRGVPVGQVADTIDRMAETTQAPAPTPVPAAPANDDGYTAESMAGFVGDPAAADALAAEAGTQRAVFPVQPIVSAADAETPSPISVPFPELGRSFRFVHPDDMPALAGLVVAQLAMAAQHEQLEAQLAAMVQIVPQFLREFMIPEDYLAFPALANSKLRGSAGVVALSNWVVTVASRYAGFPTQPAAS